MNQPLYELANEYKQSMIALGDLDLPPEAVEDTLESLSGEVTDKCKNVAIYFHNIDADVAAMEDARKRIDARIKAHKSRSQRLKDYLLDNMIKCEISVISCPEFEIKVKNNPPSVQIDDGVEIPKDYQRVSISADKTALKNALKAGEEFKGIRLIQGKSLSVK